MEDSPGSGVTGGPKRKRSIREAAGSEVLEDTMATGGENYGQGDTDGYGRLKKRAREGEGADDGESARDNGLKVRLTKRDGVLSFAPSRNNGDSGIEGIGQVQGEGEGIKGLGEEMGNRGDVELRQASSPMDLNQEVLALSVQQESELKVPSVVGAKAVTQREGGDRGAVNIGDLENISQGQQVPQTKAKEEKGQSVPSVGELPSVREPSKLEVYRIPSHAGWFSWNAIHKIEKQKLSEFFNGKSPSKNPKIYKEYRDAIISKYREDLSRPLTFTEVRRMLVGDVNTLRRVFEFLDHWGLINYHASPDPQIAPPKWGGVPPALVDTEPAGVRVVAPPIAPSTSLFEFRPSKAGKGRPAVSVPGQNGALLMTHQNAYGTAIGEAAVANAAAAMKGPVVEFHCNACGTDCSRRRHHCQKQADFDLCPSCFANGKFGAGMKSADFITMDSSEEARVSDGEEWSDQETLLLLEGLELYGDNWSEIAEHVGTKTRAQCILHFIRLPIEDPFLEDMEGRGPRSLMSKEITVEGKGDIGPGSSDVKELGEKGEVKGSETVGDKGETGGRTNGQGGTEASTEEQKKETEEQLTPFADAGNPVMAQVAFLAAMVGPRVAAAAAQAALAALTEEDPSKEASGLLALGGQEQAVNGSLPGGSMGVATNIEQKPTGNKTETGIATDLNQDAKGKSEPNGITEEDFEPSALRVRAAAATAMAAAAVKAKLLADQEERDIQRLVANVIEHQLKKLEVKLHHFDDLEDMLHKERDQVERQRQQLYAERVRLAASQSSDRSSHDPKQQQSVTVPVGNVNLGRVTPNPGVGTPSMLNRGVLKYGVSQPGDRGIQGGGVQDAKQAGIW